MVIDGPSVNVFLAITGAVGIWTVSVISGMIWLNAKFRSLEITIFREAEKARRENEARFDEHKERIMILELKVLGLTKTP